VEKEIGFVGDITSVNASLIRTLVEDGYIPVVASVAADSNGQALNVNADIAAGEVTPWLERKLAPFIRFTFPAAFRSSFKQVFLICLGSCSFVVRNIVFRFCEGRGPGAGGPGETQFDQRDGFRLDLYSERECYIFLVA